jgi:multiple sugar transport system permease protein
MAVETQPEAQAPAATLDAEPQPANLVYVVLAVGLVITLAPFLWMLLGSFKPEAELQRVPPTWWPEAPTLGNYRELFDRLDFPRFFANSVLVAVAVTIGNLVFCSMVGYALAKLDFAGKRVLFALVLGMLMVPGVVTFVPLFVLVSNLGLVNTYPGLILPFLVTPLGVFLMRQFIAGLPDELIEAARIDGAGEWRIFSRVILPLCGPPLATLGILTFLHSWNNFLWPLVVAQSEDKYTLPVALALYSVGQNATRYGLLMAGAVVIILPVVALFIALQRYFVQSVATTGIK